MCMLRFILKNYRDDHIYHLAKPNINDTTIILLAVHYITSILPMTGNYWQIVIFYNSVKTVTAIINVNKIHLESIKHKKFNCIYAECNMV